MRSSRREKERKIEICVKKQDRLKEINEKKGKQTNRSTKRL